MFSGKLLKTRIGYWRAGLKPLDGCLNTPLPQLLGSVKGGVRIDYAFSARLSADTSDTSDRLETFSSNFIPVQNSTWYIAISRKTRNYTR
jgi:hypothetical protein